MFFVQQRQCVFYVGQMLTNSCKKCRESHTEIHLTDLMTQTRLEISAIGVVYELTFLSSLINLHVHSILLYVL